MTERTLVSGAYRCDDCGYVVHLTELRHVWAMGARRLTDESFTARCPICCPIPCGDPKANRWNKFHRLGFWATVRHVFRDIWFNAKGFE